MPGASINAKTGLWKVKSGRYIFNHEALAIVFRAKLLQAIVDNNPRAPKNCPQKWVVDCKDAGKGDKALIYLGRYLYRGVIQEKDILKCENGKVTFRYLDSKSFQRDSGEPGITASFIHAAKDWSGFSSSFCELIPARCFTRKRNAPK